MSYFVDGYGWSNRSQSCHEWEEEYDRIEREREELEREREFERDYERFTELDKEQTERYIRFYDFIEKWINEPRDSKMISFEDVELEVRKIQDLEDVFDRIVPPKDTSICNLFDYDNLKHKPKFDFLVSFF